MDSPQRVVLDMDSTEIPVYGEQETRTADEHAVPRNVAVRSLEVSRGYVLQHLLLQRKLCHQPPQPRVLLLQFLQPACSSFRPPSSLRQR